MSHGKVQVLGAAALVIGLFVLVLAGYWWGRQGRGDDVPVAIGLDVAPDCVLSPAGCEAVGRGWVLRVALDHDVQPLKPFGVVATLSGEAAIRPERMSLQFDMPGMDMGINRFALRPTAEGRWRGEAMLPVCATGSRDWRVSVDVLADDGTRYRARIPLKTR